jgi:methionyl-tRNA formyltransferase
MIKKTLLGMSAPKIRVNPREDSPGVLFIGEGVGARTLETLLKQGVRVEAVMSTSPEDPVIETADVNKIPSSLMDGDTDLYFKGIGLGSMYDYAVVAFFSKTLAPVNFAKGRKKRIIGLHASELPQYRGGYPIEAVLLDDQKSTKISVYYLTPNVDDGPILVMQGYSLWDRVRKGKKASDMYQEIAVIGGGLLATTLFNINGQNARPQNGEPSYSHEPTQEELTVNWGKHTSEHIINMLAAGGKVYTTLNGKKVEIYGLAWGKKGPKYLGTSGRIVFEGRRYNKPLICTHDYRLLELISAEVRGAGLKGDDFLKYVAANHRFGFTNQFV